MILRMESSLTRTLKTKERPCYDTTGNENDVAQLLRKRTGRKSLVLLAVVEVSKEAQDGILGIRQEMMHPGWSTSRKPIALVGHCRQRRERRCQRI